MARHLSRIQIHKDGKVDMNNQTEEIPVIHCFDDRYAMPAGVAFLSMLEHADRVRRYRLVVIGEGIRETNRAKLQEIVSRFPNATLEFVSPEIDLGEEFGKLGAQGHYSKDVLYKLLVPKMFPQWRYAIVTDVDCVYRGDVSEAFDRFVSAGDFHLGGISYEGRPLRRALSALDPYAARFDERERERLRHCIGGGFLVYDLERMRKDGMTERMLAYLRENCGRLLQAEQDVLNLTEGLRIFHLPVRTMVCSYLYDWLDADERPAWAEELASPVQLHYATRTKPWNAPTCAKAEAWWECLARTPFFNEVVSALVPPPPKERTTIWKLFGLIPIVKVRAIGEVTKVRLAGRTLRA